METNERAHVDNHYGRVEVICGSMFSGKTEELIRRLRRAGFARQQVEIYKPTVDTRFSSVDVVSHEGHSISCAAVDRATDILTSYSGAEVVGIDEAQFFDDSLVSVCRQLADRGVRVIVAGLDMDFTGRPFGPMPALCATAEEVTKVHAICLGCGRLAAYSHRKVKDLQLVLLGQTDEYEPLCRACYLKALKSE